ncbi:MAG: methionyl-tRNA formyltransferase, partial [Bacteroidales bacterium]|nr:methionyl-tRNA formyltransferase [Bacteroidales bacterium]
MKNPKIVFMGTADFAVGALKELLDNDMNVVAVVTTPDKPAGRGRKLSSSPVKEFLMSQLDDDNRPVLLQPEKLKDPLFIDQLKDINADMFIVVAFRMLPEEVWSMPTMGTINLHGSLLPHYRAAAPINRAIMNGETKSGVTTFYIDDKIDTGNILLREEVPIDPNETAGELYDTLMNV